MLPRETISNGADPICPDCGKEATWFVRSNGTSNCVATHCNCGMYSRETQYTISRQEAEDWLDKINSALLSGTQYTELPDLFTFVRQ